MKRQAHSFTLIELLVVMAVLALLLGVVAPRVGKASARLLTETALTEQRQAFQETAMRARATGQPMQLLLDPDSSTLTVSVLPGNLSREWVPSVNQQEDSPASGLLGDISTFSLSKDIEWQPDDANFNADNEIVFSFFPDGEAGGAALRFSLRGVNYELEVDRITGHAVIWELD